MNIDILKEINELVELGKISSDSLVKNQKKKKIVQFLIQKDSQPNLSANQLAKQIGSSISTINRIRTDLGLKYCYRYDTPTKKSRILKDEGSFSVLNVKEDLRIEPPLTNIETVLCTPYAQVFIRPFNQQVHLRENQKNPEGIHFPKNILVEDYPISGRTHYVIFRREMKRPLA